MPCPNESLVMIHNCVQPVTSTLWTELHCRIPCPELGTQLLVEDLSLRYLLDTAVAGGRGHAHEGIALLDDVLGKHAVWLLYRA